MDSSPRVGQIVDYTVTADDAERAGWLGYTIEAGSTFRMVITRLGPGVLVNGQVILAERQAMRVTSAIEGSGPGCWQTRRKDHAVA
jgi:hypothetical protein